jgi:enoyl-CoA hydratase/carnithine racemase
VTGDLPAGAATGDDGSVDVTVESNIAVITLNRPDKLNALTLLMVRAFRAACAELDERPDVRAMVVTGAGGRAFCAGGDLRSLLPAIQDAGEDLINPDPAQRFLSTVTTPVVAAVSGVCVGGGLEVLLGTDIRIAGQTATFGLPEIRWGLIPGSGTNVRLPRQIPYAVAMEMLLTGSTITAQRAYEIGLINDVVPPECVLDRALDVASALAANGPLAARTAKEIVSGAMDLRAGFELEYALNKRVITSADSRIGVEAYANRTRPDFTGT